MNSEEATRIVLLRSVLARYLTTVLDMATSILLLTEGRSIIPASGTLLNSGSVLLVIMCTQEKKSGTPSCSH